MGFREVVLLGLVLFYSSKAFCAASKNWINNDATLNQMPQKQVTTSLQTPTKHQETNQTQQRDLAYYTGSYRIRSYQLRKAAVTAQKPLQPQVEQMQTIQGLQGSVTGELTSEQQVSRETALAQYPLPTEDPDLNSPADQNLTVVMKFEQPEPKPADSVEVHCEEEKVIVKVKQNFLGNSQLIQPSDLTLGGCAALSTADNVLLFQAELQSCSSTMMMTEDALIYTFSLMYSPTPIGNTFILKTNPAEVEIKCHYQRKQYVSSDAVSPTWTPFAADVSAEQQLHFSLRLMTEDWQWQRPSSVFFLNDTMRVEASVLQGHHLPLRVYVDACVATTTPDPNSQPSYVFIQNHGCLTDAKLTGAKSYFMQRSHEDKLHFQLKAFRFHQDLRNSHLLQGGVVLTPAWVSVEPILSLIYITCLVKATTVSVPISSQNKACSFLTEVNRWVASDGDNKVCGCCETSCSEQRLKRSLGPDAALPPDLHWEGTAALGPILLEESLEKLIKLPLDPVFMLQTSRVTQATSHPSIAKLCGVAATLAVVMLFLLCAVIHTRLRKPSGHDVCT